MNNLEKIYINFNIKNIHRTTLIKLYEIMLRIRKVQLKIEEEYPKDEMKTPVHLCVGQEAISAGFCIHLKKDDYVFTNYRGHGHYLAKGGSLKALISELYGKETGCSRGRGGSMHIIDTDAGLLGSTSIVAGGIPVGTGAALSLKMQKTNRVVLTFFGDAAVEEGVLYESINFALLKNLPVIYICENNFYAVCSFINKRQPRCNIYQRFKNWGIDTYLVDGNNVTEVYNIAKKSISNARKKSKPSFIECRTYRWYGHSGGGFDTDLGYRTKEELDEWLKRCPLKNFEKFLLKKGIITSENIEQLSKKFDKEIIEAFSFAKNSQLPDTNDISKYLFRK